MIIHIEWKPEAYLECGLWLFMVCHSNQSNSQQCFAKYRLCEAQLNSLFRSLYREQLVFPHLCRLSRLLILLHCLSVLVYGG